MKSNISKFEREYLEEEAERAYKRHEREQQRKFNRKLTAKQKEKYIIDYIEKNAQPTETHVRQSEKETNQMHILKRLIIDEKKRLSIEDMTNALRAEGFTWGIGEKTMYRRIIPELTKTELIKRGADGKYYFDENSKKVQNIRSITDRMAEKAQQSIISINIISNFLEMIKGSPVYEKAKEFIEHEKIQFTRGGRTKDVKNQKSSSRLLFLGAPESTIDSKIWEEIFDAMDTFSAINIHYTPEGKTKEQTYSVKPYQLIFDNGSWDLWGECFTPGHEGKKLFNLSRITRVSVRSMMGKFFLPADYNFLQTLSGNFGCYNDGKQKVYKIKFQKDSYAWLYSKDRIWGDKQKIRETKDGFVLSFEASQYKPILRWVLGWGDEAEPLEPAELVDEWKAKIRNMAKKI